jgi:histidine triad (HIT) family protein
MVSMAAECLFCEVVARRAPAEIFFEDELTLAFLDHRPLFAGHTLLVPKLHCETLPDLPEAQIQPLFAVARALCRAMEEALGADGSLVAVNNRVSQSVPHLHVHVVPRRRKDGLRGFFWPRAKYRDPAEAQAMCRLLRDAMQRLKPSGG